jgi:uncharacterized protein (TIGR02266 family)
MGWIAMTSSGRRDQREHARQEVEIRVDWSTGRMFVSDQATNVSESGVFLRSETGLKPDSDVEMILWLPGRPPIRATGHVVWSQDARAMPTGIMPGGGLRFTEMHSADRAMLREYLGELAAGAKPARGH